MGVQRGPPASGTTSRWQLPHGPQHGNRIGVRNFREAAATSGWYSTEQPPCQPKWVTCWEQERLGWTSGLIMPQGGCGVRNGHPPLSCTSSCPPKLCSFSFGHPQPGPGPVEQSPHSKWGDSLPSRSCSKGVEKGQVSLYRFPFSHACKEGTCQPSQSPQLLGVLCCRGANNGFHNIQHDPDTHRLLGRRRISHLLLSKGNSPTMRLLRAYNSTSMHKCNKNIMIPFLCEASNCQVFWIFYKLGIWLWVSCHLTSRSRNLYRIHRKDHFSSVSANYILAYAPNLVGAILYSMLLIMVNRVSRLVNKTKQTDIVINRTEDIAPVKGKTGFSLNLVITQDLAMLSAITLLDRYLL